MKAKLIVEGREFPVEINDPELEKLVKPPKKTGYERVSPGDDYFYVVDAEVCVTSDDTSNDEESYEAANYYSDRTVAENNARADKLMRQLRRFAVVHRINDRVAERYYICYVDNKILQLQRDTVNRYMGPWFDDLNIGARAIETFHDELIWYFTKYKDSL